MSSKLLNVEIVSPQKEVFKGAAISVNVPGKQSPFQILFDHAPIISTLDIGIVKIIDENNKSNYFAIYNGFVEVAMNQVTIIVQDVATQSEVDEKTVNDAINQYKLQLQEADKQQKELLVQKILFNEAKLKIISFNR
jgi:F-type H+-transporting ATPase subunit epsilon